MAHGPPNISCVAVLFGRYIIKCPNEFYSKCDVLSSVLGVYLPAYYYEPRRHSKLDSVWRGSDKFEIVNIFAFTVAGKVVTTKGALIAKISRRGASELSEILRWRRKNRSSDSDLLERSNAQRGAIITHQ